MKQTALATREFSYFSRLHAQVAYSSHANPANTRHKFLSLDSDAAIYTFTYGYERR